MANKATSPLTLSLALESHHVILVWVNAGFLEVPNTIHNTSHFFQLVKCFPKAFDIGRPKLAKWNTVLFFWFHNTTFNFVLPCRMLQRSFCNVAFLITFWCLFVTSGLHSKINQYKVPCPQSTKKCTFPAGNHGGCSLLQIETECVEGWGMGIGLCHCWWGQCLPCLSQPTPPCNFSSYGLTSAQKILFL